MLRAFDYLAEVMSKRGHHNLGHSGYILTALQRHTGKVTSAQLAAALFHDIIYVPGCSENEENSVEKMVDHFDFYGDSPADLAIDMINATKNPSLAICDEVKHFVDADNAVLGGDFIAYANYRSAIRKEYAKYSDEEFYRGRAEWIEKTLAKPSIFITIEFSGLEVRAARNLESELTFCKHQLGVEV